MIIYLILELHPIMRCIFKKNESKLYFSLDMEFRIYFEGNIEIKIKQKTPKQCRYYSFIKFLIINWELTDISGSRPNVEESLQYIQTHT